MPHPNDVSRVNVLIIHSKPMTKNGEIEYETLGKINVVFNGTDISNVCTEEGMFAIRDQREYIIKANWIKNEQKPEKLEKDKIVYEFEPIKLKKQEKKR